MHNQVQLLNIWRLPSVANELFAVFKDEFVVCEALRKKASLKRSWKRYERQRYVKSNLAREMIGISSPYAWDRVVA